MIEEYFSHRTWARLSSLVEGYQNGTWENLGTYLVRLGTTLFVPTFLLCAQGTAVPKRLYPLVQAYKRPPGLKLKSFEPGARDKSARYDDGDRGYGS